VTPAALRRRIRERLDRGERAFVVVWLALMITTLLGFAGFAVDLSNWWLQTERIQRAADAGAHAGVVFLPADLPGATSTARAEVAKNGYSQADGDTIVVNQEPNPNRLRVSVTTEVRNYFVSLFGLESITLERDAVAEYIAPVPMGSPENKLGNDPSNGHDTPQFWVNVDGPNTRKITGDRFAAKNCPGSVVNCTGTVLPGINNDEYSFDGYFFALDVTSPPPGQPLKVKVYDPAMTFVNDTCGRNIFPNDTQRQTLQNLPGNPYPDAVERFARGNTRWCNGDQSIDGRYDTETTFIVREPDNTPWSDTDNPVVPGCTVTMPAFRPGESGFGTMFQMLHPDTAAAAGGVVTLNNGETVSFGELFRQNYTICEIPPGQVQTGEYILQIRSNATAANPLQYSAAVNSGGKNRFSILVGFGDEGVEQLNGGAVSINARGRMPIYANADAADTQFYLARVLPYDAGRTLRITLYDMGDAAQAGTLQILPPTEYAPTFSGCAFQRNDGANLTTDPATCTMSNVSAANGFAGRAVDVDIPIPSDYTCDENSLLGCWVQVRAAFPAGVTDTTTWSATILGNPIRLVE